MCQSYNEAYDTDFGGEEGTGSKEKDTRGRGGHAFGKSRSCKEKKRGAVGSGEGTSTRGSTALPVGESIIRIV